MTKNKCIFAVHNDKRKPYPKEYIEALNSRIKFLEQLLVKSNVQFAPIPDIPPCDSSSTFSLFKDSLYFRQLKHQPSSDYVMKLSTRTGQLSVTENGLRYFGPTSNLHLLSSIVWTRRPHADLLAKGKTAIQNVGLDYDVPSTKKAHLLSLFWTWHNPFLGIVDKKLFLRDMGFFYINQSNVVTADNNDPALTPNYTAQDTTVHTIKYFSPLLLNAILALGSLLDDSCNDHPYHIKARILLNIELEGPQVTTIQAATLLGIYEIMSNRDTLGWVYLGMAMRMAVDMGYHLDQKKWVEQGFITEEESEARSKAFWGCFSAERIWSFYLGRPSCLRLADVEISCQTKDPKISNDLEPWIPYVTPDAELSKFWKEYTSLSQTNLTNMSLLKLIELLAEIQEVFFSDLQKYTQAQLWDFASQMYVKLTNWYTTLPSPLLCSENSQKPVVAHIMLLHLQYHYTVIELFKPFIYEEQNKNMNIPKHNTNDLYASAENDFLSKPILPSTLASTHAARVCRKSAFQISNLIEKYHNWYSFDRAHPTAVQITFSAALIHLNNAWSQVNANKSDSTAALKTCCRALESMGSIYKSAKRALYILTCLVHKASYGLLNNKHLKLSSNTDNLTKIIDDAFTSPRPQPTLAQIHSNIKNTLTQRQGTQKQRWRNFELKTKIFERKGTLNINDSDRENDNTSSIKDTTEFHATENIPEPLRDDVLNNLDFNMSNVPIWISTPESGYLVEYAEDSPFYNEDVNNDDIK